MNDIIATETVFIVDDDEAVRDSLSLLLKAEGFTVSAYESGDNFLQSATDQTIGCILLDIRMPGTNGMEVQELLLARGCRLPIIFITGHGDVPMAVEALRQGAFDFIQKPFRDDELISRVREALETNRTEQDNLEKLQQIKERLESLTPREREVMEMVTKGSANKVIAMDLNLSQRTVEIHRARVMEKMGARSLAELVRMSVIMVDAQD